MLVRNRPFVVLDSSRSSVYEDLIKFPAGDGISLLELSSMEEDSLGERLSVLWELEPGAKVIERSELPVPLSPTGFDSPRRLDAFLDAVRWGAISSVDETRLQAPFRSGIEIEEYQLDPVIRSLRMPRVNLLIADDVGLGKTIETGLVVQELLLRHRARTVLVVCPSALQIQWKEQMLDKFGLEFRIINSEELRNLRRKRGLHINPWTHFPRLITSIDFIKRERPMQLLKEILPSAGAPKYPRTFDVLIVDEAHNVAPAGSGSLSYARESDRTRVIRALVPHCEHKLFLSATPHNGYPESFSALLELLDSQRFARSVEPSPEQKDAVMVRRLKSEILEWDSKPRFASRVIIALGVDYTDEERAVHQDLREYTRLRLKSADHAQSMATLFVLKLLKKRLFSSPAAFAATLQQHAKALGGRGKVVPGSKLAPDVLRRKIRAVEEDYNDDREYIELESDTLTSATCVQRSLTAEERELLERMQHYALSARDRPDAKATLLLHWLKDFVKPDGCWNDNRVLIFTEYRATLNYLHTLLAAQGLDKDGRLNIIHGEVSLEDRDAIKKAFQASPQDSAVRILLATDAASEGIDLQNHCHTLVHYEIPWNPNRLEQRNGRLDRHGQRSAVVTVHHFVGAGFDEHIARGAQPGDLEGDLEFLMRAVIKVNNIREDLGSVGPVIATRIEDAMLRAQGSLDLREVEDKARSLHSMTKSRRDINADLKRFKDRLEQSRSDLHAEPDSVRRVVEVALEMSDKPPLQPTTVTGADGERLSAWHIPRLDGSWARCAEGLPHPHTHVLRPVVFDELLSRQRDDVVLAHLNHRLVQSATRKLRSQIWDTADRRLHRIAARIVPDSACREPAVIAYARLVVLGADNHRLHEELITAGGFLREGRFNRMNVGQVEQALAGATEREAPQDIKQRFCGLWPAIENALKAALEARKTERTKNLDKNMEETCLREIEKLRAILTELATAIKLKLAEQPPRQMELWTAPEREQLERDRGYLQQRLIEIPAEIERESDAILRRYAGPTPWLFPFAVCFLVPQSLAPGGGR